MRMAARGRCATVVAAGAGLTAALLAACGGGDGVNLVDASNTLLKANVCRELGVGDNPGAVPAGSPAADSVESSLGCEDGSGKVLVTLSSFGSEDDRDAACASLQGDARALCGTGANLWVMRASDDEVASAVSTALGDRVRSATDLR